MKRFLLPSFIVVICTHLIVITLVVIFSHVSGPALINKSKKKKLDKMLVWDIQEYIEPKLEIKPSAELVVERNESDELVKSTPVIISQSKPRLKSALAPVPKKKMLKQIRRAKKTFEKKAVTKLLRKMVKVEASQVKEVSPSRLKLRSKRELSREYQISLRRLIVNELVYPRFAQRMGQEGITKVKVSVLDNGSFFNIKLHQSSGYKKLDQDALELISSLSSKVENKLKRSMSLIIPVEYNLETLPF